MRTKNFLKTTFGLAFVAVLLTMMSCKKDDPKSNLTGILTFGFTNDIVKDYPFTIDNVSYVIQNKDSLPYQFNATKLIAKFSLIAGSAITVNGVPQVSEVTINDFTNGITLKVVAEDGVTTKNYQVKVNVAKNNPEALKWNQANPNAFDATLETQEHFFLNGKHFVVLGKKFVWFESDPESKLYSTTNGTTWTKETISNASFPVGFGHNIVVSGNKAYCVGYVSGVDTYGALQPALEKNLYTSTDGITWTKTAGALDVARVFSPSFQLGGSIYAFGGNTQGAFGAFDGSKPAGSLFYPASAISSSTLISTNGTTFAASANYTTTMPKRTWAASYVYNNKMYIAGGLSAAGVPLNDVWSSTDGVTWTQVSTGAFKARVKASCVSYDNKIWMIGGVVAEGTCEAGMLVSKDGGITWAPVAADQDLPASFKARCNANVFVDANGNLWIIGGQSTSVVGKSIEYTALSDVWIGKLNKL